MSDVMIKALDDGRYDVEIRQGGSTSTHRVTVPADVVDDLDLGSVDGEVVVRESMAFLLEREPPSSIMAEFSLTDIQRYFGEFYDELPGRVQAGGQRR